VILNDEMQGVKFYWWISINYASVIWSRVAKFGTVTQVDEKPVSKGSAMPLIPGPQHPQHF